jgi:hypothetical protein
LKIKQIISRLREAEKDEVELFDNDDAILKEKQKNQARRSRNAFSSGM